MRVIGLLTFKDLRRRLADPAGFLLQLAIPLALAGMLALAFGGKRGAGSAAAPVLRFLLVDLDQTPITRFMAGAPQAPEAAGRIEMKRALNREEGLRLLRDEEFAALLVIPKGFSENLLDGHRVDLELVKNPSQTIMPVVAQQGGEVLALYLSIAAQLLGDEAGHLKALFKGDGWSDTAALASLLASLRGRLEAVQGLLFPPLVDFETVKAGERPGSFDFLSWMYPGMVVMGLMFIAIMQMRDLLRERDEGTLRRQLTAPLGAGQILIAKVAAVAVVVGTAHVVLLVIGRLAFGIRWGSPGPLLAVSLALVLAVTGFAALVFSIVRTERQGDALGGIATMVMSLLGGAMIPPQVLPPGLQVVARFTVNYWGNEALRALSAGGSGKTIGAPLVVLAALGSTLTLLGVALLARRHLRGTL